MYRFLSVNNHKNGDDAETCSCTWRSYRNLPVPM